MSKREEIIAVLVFFFVGISIVIPFLLRGEKQGELFEVKSVVDGDTLLLERKGNTYTARVLGYDAFESYSGSEKALCQAKYFKISLEEASERGLEAKGFLIKTLENKEIRASFEKKDKYNRDLARVFADGVDVAQSMLQSGFAHEYLGSRLYEGCKG